MFTYQTTIRLRDTDAAGIIYFARQLALAHEALEEFLESQGEGLAKTIRNGAVIFPVVHAEGDYLRPVTVGDRLTVQLTIERIGKTSFTAAYLLLNTAGERVGTAQTVHVAVDRRTHAKVPLPPPLAEALRAIRPAQH